MDEEPRRFLCRITPVFPRNTFLVSQKTNQAPSTQVRRKNLKTQQSPITLDLCLRKPRSGKSRDYRDVIVYEKAPFSKRSLHSKLQSPHFQKASVFVKLRFGDRYVRAIGLTVESNFSGAVSTSFPGLGIGAVWTGA